MQKTPAKKSNKKTTSKKKKPPKDPIAEYKSFMTDSKADMELLTLGSDDLWSTVPGYISTQSLSLNKALGVPGIPMGRITEIIGDEHVGKSTLMDHLFAETQRLGGITVLFDPEIGRDAKYTRSIGVDPDRLICPQPKKDKFYTLESTFNYIGKTCDFWGKNNPEKLPVLVGVDSIAGMPTESDLTRGAGERQPGNAASVIRHSLRNLQQRAAQAGVTLVFVNQFYDKIGPFGGKQAYGGRGLRYGASLRLQLYRGTLGTDSSVLKLPDGRVFGGVTIVEIKKTKISGMSLTKAEVPIRSGAGIDNYWSLFRELKKAGLISTGGAWSSMIPPGETDPVKWQGSHFGLSKYLEDKPEVYRQLVDVYMSL